MNKRFRPTLEKYRKLERDLANEKECSRINFHAMAESREKWINNFRIQEAITKDLLERLTESRMKVTLLARIASMSLLLSFMSIAYSAYQIALCL